MFGFVLRFIKSKPAMTATATATTMTITIMIKLLPELPLLLLPVRAMLSVSGSPL